MIDEAAELQRIMTEGLLFPIFQPILDFRLRAILGYEALMRGPEGSPLHRPDQLFGAAARLGLTNDLEHLCRQASLRAFAAQRLAGRLVPRVQMQRVASDAVSFSTFLNRSAATYGGRELLCNTLHDRQVDTQMYVMEVRRHPEPVMLMLPESGG